MPQGKGRESNPTYSYLLIDLGNGHGNTSASVNTGKED